MTGCSRCLDSWNLDIDQILLEAQHRWLRPVEAYEILINYWKFELTLEPPNRPPDGSLFLFDRKALRSFRKDGYRWMKRNDGIIRESHEKLKACGVDVVHCHYARREDNEKFQRRIYWLLDRQLEHIVLVHYREVNEDVKPGISRLLSDRRTHLAGSLSNSDNGFAVESYPASTTQTSFISSAGRGDLQNMVSLNLGVSSFPKIVDHPPPPSSIPHENSGSGFAVESSPASTVQFCLVSSGGKAHSQNADSMNLGDFSFPRAGDRALPQSTFRNENSGGGFVAESSPVSTIRFSLVSKAGRADSQNVDSMKSRVFSFSKTVDRPPPKSFIPHGNSGGRVAVESSPASTVQFSLLSRAGRADSQNVNSMNSKILSFPRAADRLLPQSSFRNENSGGGFMVESSPASAVQTSLGSHADRVDIQNAEIPNLGVFSFPKAADRPPPHSSIPRENSGGGFAPECSPASTVQIPLLCGSSSADSQNVDSLNSRVFACPKAADRPPPQSFRPENFGGGFDVESSSASTVQTSFVCGAGRDPLSMNQHPAWFSRDICRVRTGSPDLAKNDASTCGTSSDQQQNVARFSSERTILGEYILQKLADWRFKPQSRLSYVASGENLASSSGHDNLAVHAEQQNQQNKAAGTHRGNYNGNVYVRRRRKGGQHLEGIPDSDDLTTGVVSDAGSVHKNISIEEQLVEAVRMESTHIDQDIQIEEQSVKAFGMESNHIEQSCWVEEQSIEAVGLKSTHTEQDVRKGEGVEENISVEEQSHAAVGIELTDKDKGHSGLVDNGETRPGMEGTIVVLNEGQQPGSNGVAAMKRPSLPFVRSSPIWETVESLEIFRRFPQYPHFLPLTDASEGNREGLAIAKMVTFASTAEDALKLSTNDPVTRFTDCLETLHNLELHGFDIKSLDNHLTKLLKSQVSELQHEMVEVEDEIRKTVKKIKSSQEKLESAVSRKEEKDLEISRLRTSLDVLEGAIRGNRIEFEDLNKSW